MPESIHDLFTKVREHPDFAGGTVFVREDVATALDVPAESVTPAMLMDAQKIIENYIFGGIYGWTEALADNIEIPA